MQQLSPEALVGATLGEYKLEHLIGKTEVSSVYLATNPRSGTPYTLRLLYVNADAATPEGAAYRTRLQQQASHIQTLQHPYILPLLDFGIWRGLPYLVWPSISARSLSSCLTQNVPLDVVTVGRYLDQITAALEYAHEQATLHRNLTPDCISIQRDGQLIVADFGVRRMIELGRQDAQRYALYELDEACAPEQLLGQRTNTFTDVYALGCVLYRMLTGHPVFTGSTREELGHLHLHASAPPLASWRGGLPPELDTVIAAALAKEPEQRESHPGAIANAYHQIISPNNLARVPFATHAAPATAWQPQPAIGMDGWHDQHAAPGGVSVREQHPPMPEPSPRVLAPPGAQGAGAGGRAATTIAAPAQRTPRRQSSLTLAMAALLIVAVIAGGAFLLLRGTTGGLAGSATVTFSDSSSNDIGHTDALTLTATNLPAPQAGYSYVAWLIDTHKEHVRSLGPLTQKGNSFVLVYNGDGTGGHSGTNLLGAGDKLEISQERGAQTAPIGTVVLSVVFPHNAFIHVQHLLLSFPATPNGIGLTAGLLQQAQLLNMDATFLRQAATSGDDVAITCVAQSMLDIIQGAHSPQYKPLGEACKEKGIAATGDGFGLLKSPTAGNSEATGYLEGASDHASLAANGPDATAAIRAHGAEVITAITNMKGWLATIAQEATDLAREPLNMAEGQAIATLCDHLYHGFDADGDGHIDPVAGESGAIGAYTASQQMATLTLAPPK